MGEVIRLLIVDDNPGDRLLIKRCLTASEAYAFEFVEADSAIQGLDRLAEGDIDCVLLDIRMPAMSGWDAYAEIESSFHEVPVVMMSGAVIAPQRPERTHRHVLDLLSKAEMTTASAVSAIRRAMCAKRSADMSLSSRA